MLDELKEERIVNKVGGRFQAVHAHSEAFSGVETGGSRPLVDLQTENKLEIVGPRDHGR